ncbi:hypothetical protein [Pelagicoccus mobilis]|uniref:DUF3108 domain-containing protein n=1 Tax=Pelagicoccus mobilis TaxID=415221 RepID=A0A934RUX2_9BACT|nr:hypothetical protein [Pelagicoccus mobilis]MBK1875281.1 hypothetical protein [Pelagicoccus mobilis]
MPQLRAVCVLIVSSLFIHSSISAEDKIDAYHFLGGQLNVFTKKGRFPVTKVTPKHIHYEDGAKTGKTKTSASCSLSFAPSLTTAFIEIEEANLNFASWKQQLRASQAIQDSLDPHAGIEAQVNEMISTGEYDDDSEADTIFVRAKLSPNLDLSDVFCAVILHYPERYTKKSNKIPAGVLVRAAHIGNLRHGTIETVRFSKRVPTFKPKGAKCDLFFFSKSGKPIATNRSPSLKIVEVDKNTAKETLPSGVLTN